MEFIDEILYRKISSADLKNIEGAKKPDSGGGQTYIDVSGVSLDGIVSFLRYGVEDPEKRKVNSDGTEYPAIIINATAIGTNNKKSLKFIPRLGKNCTVRNYYIAQQYQDRHPAWSSPLGFPVLKDLFKAGASISNSHSATVDARIRDLVIFILLTKSGKYYAGFNNSNILPTNWPSGVGLEKMLPANWSVRGGNTSQGIIKPTILLGFENIKKTLYDASAAASSITFDEEDGDYVKETENTPVVGLSAAAFLNSYERPIELAEPQAGKKKLKRDPRIGKAVIIESNYKCTTDPSHASFTSRSTNQPYMEPHHLIPASQYENFTENIDCIQNIVSLCPNCHALVHYGIGTEVEPILEKLFNLRCSGFSKAGIQISFEELKEFYALL